MDVWRQGARGQRGLALVVVLWVLVLLSLVGASFTFTTRNEVTLTRNLIEAAKAEAIADAGIHRAILGLLDPNEVTRWRADGRLYVFRLGAEWDAIAAEANDGNGEGEQVKGDRVEITIQDEIGKIDLNRAQDELLQSLFGLAGLGPDDAAALLGIVGLNADGTGCRVVGAGA